MLLFRLGLTDLGVGVGSARAAPVSPLNGEYQFESVQRAGHTAELAAGDRLRVKISDSTAEIFLEPGSTQGVSQVIKSLCSRVISKGALTFKSGKIAQASQGSVEFRLQEMRGDKGDQPCPLGLFLPELLGSAFPEPVLPGKLKVEFGYEVRGARLSLTWKQEKGSSLVVFRKL